MTFLPDVATLLAYALACLVLVTTPGPDMSLFLARTLSSGRAAGIAALMGASAGCCAHTMLAAFGISALLAASVTAFTILKVVGAVYLLWLAVDAIRHGSALNLRAEPSSTVSLVRTFLIGMGTNLTNPKVVLFFVTFLPQFVDAGDPNAARKLVFLGLFMVVFSLPFSLLMILGAERAAGFMTRHPGVMRAMDYAFAGVFGLFALRIAALQAR